MQSLVERILEEGRYLGNEIVKVDSFLNHQVDSALMVEVGRTFYTRLAADSAPIDKVLTAEASGIMPALTTAMQANCRMVYARKTQSKTMVDDFYEGHAISRTRGNHVTLRVNKNYLQAGERVLIIDDFLATGSGIGAMIDIIDQAGAVLVGVGAVIEKPVEGGRPHIRKHLRATCPVASLACISFDGDKVIAEVGRLAQEQPSAS